MGFFKWVRRRVHGPSALSRGDVEEFDEETSEMISASDALLSRMRVGSIDLTRKRMVTHLFLGNDRDLDRASRLLESLGYSSDEMGSGRLVVSEQVAVGEGWVRRVVPVMMQTAGEFELIYDGWDADVAADHTGQDN
ncbi:hypothetical protein FPZ24_06970 [Sphingomonas panacisoli]|uniref:Regulator of ribonuclease activity B domain-containing protein n=1 Tax=Sphingomonas panacisoli TaxID=1813879 RepID=A0A5B8LHB4_9SPHN|nr:ribonuclease E inhibitor RraB [Sphingomonas panacisoli]QDZ07249.1 hypothetical protein FPZ24_06970 [Sphingomonas panacisoli]